MNPPSPISSIFIVIETLQIQLKFSQSLSKMMELCSPSPPSIVARDPNPMRPKNSPSPGLRRANSTRRAPATGAGAGEEGRPNPDCLASSERVTERAIKPVFSGEARALGEDMVYSALACWGLVAEDRSKDGFSRSGDYYSREPREAEGI
ncbi:uncharacterized protein A4U43_C09F15580 [Asparagus officinalis]|uniref:Uncharacterized protein n=1 Tax=Asparagus officinalis TaxID=4686 RepID=A0A5P1E7M3_ASPOF|nr:uncharacterized protein A4U43_C09F15580 [Asparagus officinalis]